MMHAYTGVTDETAGEVVTVRWLTAGLFKSLTVVLAATHTAMYGHW